LKKHQISGLQVFKRDRPTLIYLGFSGTRQFNIKNILINDSHKPGTVDSTASVSPQVVPHSLPFSIFLAQPFFDFSIIEMRLGGLRIC
jgi:hypothetical protein